MVTDVCSTCPLLSKRYKKHAENQHYHQLQSTIVKDELVTLHGNEI